jgi:esterase/lipase superfamily enzyme
LDLKTTEVVLHGLLVVSLILVDIPYVVENIRNDDAILPIEFLFDVKAPKVILERLRAVSLIFKCIPMFLRMLAVSMLSYPLIFSYI